MKTVDLNLCPHGWKKTLGLGLTFQNERMKLLLEQMLSEVGAQILYATDIIDVTTEGNRITGLIVHNKSGLSYVSAKVYIDATGDGDICAMAGNPFDFGDEEGGLAAASLEMHVDHVDKAELTAYMRETNDIRFKAIISRLKEEGIWKFPYEIFISVNLTRDDVFMINTIRQVGINGVDAESLTRGVVTGRSENFALLDVMRTYFPGFRNAEIRQIAPVIGIRETRRVRCCYTLRVSDLIEGKTFPDSVAVSGYGWDMPNPKAPSRQPFEKVARKSPFAEIPYRCLLPEKTDNLIAVGRCIGAEREALGVVRVMGPCIAMGEAAGIAAHLARQTDCNFKRVDVSVLRQEIMRQGGIPDSAHVPD